jgi:hypothetical protein
MFHVGFEVAAAASNTGVVDGPEMEVPSSSGVPLHSSQASLLSLLLQVKGPMMLG